MTAEEAIEEICALSPLAPDDVVAFASMTGDELAAVVMTYRDAGAITEPGTWQRIAEILRTTSEFVGVALPLVQAVELVFAL